MKKNFRAIALGLIGLAFFSCEDKNEPINQGVETPLVGQEKTFTLSATMGEVAIEPLANNTNPQVSDDDLRATLHFNDSKTWATTSYAWNEFGTEAGQTNARWGALLGVNNQPDAKSCTKSSEGEITSGTVDQNTIWFNILENETIAGQKLKMYCKTGSSFGGNVNKSWMCLGGRPGGDSGEELTRQYFKIGEDSDPNKEIAGLKVGQKQEGRDIPVMTHVRSYADFKQKADGGQADATFAPRGSLIGLIINNKLGRSITITDIIVRKDNALNFSGYFDWNVTEEGLHHAKFTSQYPKNIGTAITIPVKQDGTNNVILPNDDEAKKHNDNPTIFYLWGIQNPDRTKQPLRLQIRYKSTVNGVANTVLTSRTFRIYAGKTKAEGEKGEFADGRAYKTILKLDEIQQKSGTYEGSKDWQDGEDYVVNVKLNALNPLTLVAKYDIAKTDITNGTAQLKFVTNHKIKANEAGDNVETDYTKFEEGKDVGYYTWAEAMRLFGYDVEDDTAPIYDETQSSDDDKWTKGGGWDNLDKVQFKTRKYRTIAGQEYYLPNNKEFVAIVPYWIYQEKSLALQDKNRNQNNFLQLISFTNDWANHLSDNTQQVRKLGKGTGKDGLSDVQIGDIILQAKDYSDEYTTKEAGTGSSNYVTYAIRFKGTKFESAWRYEYKKAEMIGTTQTYNLIIKNVMLTKNSGKTLAGANSIATEDFFNINNATERILPAYGLIKYKYNPNGIPSSNSTASYVGAWGYRWSSSLYNSIFAYYHRFARDTFVGNSYRIRGFALRPFAKN